MTRAVLITLVVTLAALGTAAALQLEHRYAMEDRV